MAETANIELRSSRQSEWLSQLERDHDNLRAAIEWALQNISSADAGEELALRLAGALRWFWRMRGHFYEGCYWLAEALQRTPPKRSIARASALLGLSQLRNGLGDLGATRPPAAESVQLFRELGDERCLAEALIIEGVTMRWQGEGEQGKAETREALELYRKSEDRWGEAQALYRLGISLADYGGHQAGHLMLEQSASILEGLQEKYIYSSVLISLGIVDLSLGNYPRARSAIEGGLAAARDIKHPWGIADALSNLGGLFRILGDYGKAESVLLESLEVYHGQGRNIWEVDALCGLAENAIVQGDFMAAHQRLETAVETLGNSENTWLKVLVLYFQGYLAYHETQYKKASKLLDEAITLARQGEFLPDLARALVTQGRVQARLAALESASGLIAEGLVIFTDNFHKLGMVSAIESLAELKIAQGEYNQAVELLSGAHNFRQVLGAPLPPVEHHNHEQLLEQCRARLGEASYAEAWQAGLSMPFEQVVAEITNS